jgi:hypothetical protein
VRLVFEEENRTNALSTGNIATLGTQSGNDIWQLIVPGPAERRKLINVISNQWKRLFKLQLPLMESRPDKSDIHVAI